MIKQIVILFFLCLACCCQARAQNFNRFDENGLRHGPWQKFYKTSDQLRYNGFFDHGREVGIFNFYDKNGGHPTATKEYTVGKELIDVKYYTTSGKKISEGKMKGRAKEGEWMYYHKNGKTVMAKEQYLNNDLEGERLVFFIDGQKAQQTNYRNGLREGNDIHYNETGSVLKAFVYVNDKLDGPVKFYTYDGNLLREGYYKANRKHGTWNYYVNGKLDKTLKFPQNKIGVNN